MRITGGEFSGLKLDAPKGPGIRPTLDHVRQALFNLLGPRVVGARVLDLFSGTGALGIEALSRGAAQVTLVDRSYFCIQAIEANLATLPASQRNPLPYSVLRAEAETAIRRFHREGALFDVVLLDPPYGKHLARKTLSALVHYAIVQKLGCVVAEHDKRDPLPELVTGKEAGFVRQRFERYGDTALTFYLHQ